MKERREEAGKTAILKQKFTTLNRRVKDFETSYRGIDLISRRRHFSYNMGRVVEALNFPFDYLPYPGE